MSKQMVIGCSFPKKAIISNLLLESLVSLDGLTRFLGLYLFSLPREVD